MASVVSIMLIVIACICFVGAFSVGKADTKAKFAVLTTILIILSLESSLNLI